MASDQKYEPNITTQVIGRLFSSLLLLILMLSVIFTIREFIINGRVGAITVIFRTISYGLFVFISMVMAVLVISVIRTKFLVIGMLAAALYFTIAFSSILRIASKINLTQNIGFTPIFLHGEVTNFSIIFLSVDQILIAVLIVLTLHLRITPLFTNKEAEQNK